MAEKHRPNVLPHFENTKMTKEVGNDKLCQDSKGKILAKPTFIYKSSSPSLWKKPSGKLRHIVKTCREKPKRIRTLSAPYAVKTVDDAFKSLALDSRKKYDGTEAVTNPTHFPTADLFESTQTWQSTETITTTTCKLTMTSQRRDSVDNSDKNISNLSFKELNYKAKRSPETFSTDKLQTCEVGYQARERTPSFEARCYVDTTPEELAFYIEDYLVLPKKMSAMAEMMYL